MKKEVLFAILLGLGLGLVITYGVYQARNSLVPQPDVSPLQASPSPTIDPDVMSSLVLTSPADESIQTETGVTVAGTTKANSFVTISINEQVFVTTADRSGNFSIEADLDEEANIIQVVAVDEDGQLSRQERTVIVSDLLVSESDDATDSAATEDSQ